MPSGDAKVKKLPSRLDQEMGRTSPLVTGAGQWKAALPFRWNGIAYVEVNIRFMSSCIELRQTGVVATTRNLTDGSEKREKRLLKRFFRCDR
jgi:hypothetical protein